jgi:hypothetical protein
VYVTLGPSADRVGYGFIGENPFEEFQLTLLFPGGTLGSDALPLTLPLQSATAANLHWLGLSGALDGTISSYSSVEVPEPAYVTLVLMLFLFAGSGRSAGRVLHLPVDVDATMG